MDNFFALADIYSLVPFSEESPNSIQDTAKPFIVEKIRLTES
jgi:hypothetical protein